MIKKLCIVLAAIFINTSPSLAATKGALDGKTFAVELKDEGADKPDPDNLIFKDGTFRSTACDEYGYNAAPYTADQKTTGTNFTAETHNPKGAKIAWNGTVTGNKVEGKAVMTYASGEKSNMTFHGTVK